MAVHVIINPGTEPSSTATLANAEKVAEFMREDLDLPAGCYVRVPIRDADGWFAFDFKNKDGRVLQVDIPGDDPDTVRKGEPWVSRRLYVNGSSWLYGFALNRFSDGDKD